MPLSPAASNHGTLNLLGEAVVLLSVEKVGSYRLQVSWRQSAALGVDEQPAQTFVLQQGDDSWETVELTVTLKEGRHVVRGRALNADSTEGGGELRV